MEAWLPASENIKQPAHEIMIAINITSWIDSYFDNVMMKFIINNRTDA